ncbi:MAG: ATP-binding cassette domain-containing protein [Lactobacillaceae bacterium]
MKLLNNVTFVYSPSKVILNDFSLTVPAPGLTWIKGKNDSGKSTLLKLILGIIKPATGDIPAANLDWSYIPDSSEIFLQGISTRIFYEYTIKLLKLNQEKSWSQIKRFQAQLRFDNSLLDKNISTLSLGQKKKALIIDYLLNPSKYMVLDELFSGLDQQTVLKLVTIINSIPKDKLILLTAHNFKEKI